MVEDVIREAIERGDFDNLPGKGKPLTFVQDPLVDSMTSIVNRILLDNGVSHPLLEARKMIVAEAEQCRASLRRAWSDYLYSGSQDAWGETICKFRARVKDINREVRIFNLKSPSTALHGLIIDAEGEIAKICEVDARNQTADVTSN